MANGDDLYIMDRRKTKSDVGRDEAKKVKAFNKFKVSQEGIKSIFFQQIADLSKIKEKLDRVERPYYESKVRTFLHEITDAQKSQQTQVEKLSLNNVPFVR